MLRKNKKGQSNAKLILFIVIYWLVFGIFFISFSQAGGVNLGDLNSTVVDLDSTIQIDENGTITTPSVTQSVSYFRNFFGFGITGIPFILALIINVPPTLVLLFMLAQLIRGSA